MWRPAFVQQDLHPFGFQNERRSVWQAQDVYLKASPFFYADKIKLPLLLVHGEDDANPGTEPFQSRKLYQAIRGNGTTRLVMLPNEPLVHRAGIERAAGGGNAELVRHLREERQVREQATSGWPFCRDNEWADGLDPDAQSGIGKPPAMRHPVHRAAKLGMETDQETSMHRNGMRAITFVIATLLAGMTHEVKRRLCGQMTAATLAALHANVRAWRNLERSTHALKALQAPPDVRFQQAEQLYGECLRHHGYLHLQAARNADDARLANTQGEVAGTCGRIAAIAKQALRDAPAQAAWIEPHADLRERALREGAAGQCSAGGCGRRWPTRRWTASGDCTGSCCNRRPLRASNMKAARLTAAPMREPSRLPDRSLREAAWRLLAGNGVAAPRNGNGAAGPGPPQRASVGTAGRWNCA